MKNFHVSNGFRPQRMAAPSFSRIVDYGSKENDLVYVPILFEEEDTFVSSRNADSFTNSGAPSTNQNKKPPKKLSSYVTKGGAALATVQVVPDIVQSALNKVSNLVDTTTNFANDTIEKASSVRDNYREKFPKGSHEDQNTQHGPIDYNNDTDVYLPLKNDSGNDLDYTNKDLDSPAHTDVSGIEDEFLEEDNHEPGESESENFDIGY